MRKILKSAYMFLSVHYDKEYVFIIYILKSFTKNHAFRFTFKFKRIKE